jgi:hypothetical protein
MPDIPDRLYIDKDDRQLYDELDLEDMLKLREKGGRRTRKEQFILAMATGLKNGVKRPLVTKEGIFFVKDLRSEDEALIGAVALHDSGSVEVLGSKQEMYRIAEEYARAGIRLISDMLRSVPNGTFDKCLERELFEMMNEH